jgi:hypothetical protein
MEVGIFYGHLSILWPFDLFYDRLLYFVVIWYILWLFGIFFHVLVCCPKKKIWQPCFRLESEHFFQCFLCCKFTRAKK